MARPRSFDESVVLSQAGAIFANLGYHGASIDDLLLATGLQRGSLYKAFGSKLTLFQKSLSAALAPNWHQEPLSLDLMIVAMRELTRDHSEIRDICLNAIVDVWDKSTMDAALVFGSRLISNLEKKNA
jgi:AcrR family transcriptional regulator